MECQCTEACLVYLRGSTSFLYPQPATVLRCLAFCLGGQHPVLMASTPASAACVLPYRKASSCIATSCLVERHRAASPGACRPPCTIVQSRGCGCMRSLCAPPDRYCGAYVLVDNRNLSRRFSQPEVAIEPNRVIM